MDGMNHGRRVGDNSASKQCRVIKNSPKLSLLVLMQPRTPNTESPSWYFRSCQHLIHPYTESTDLRDL